MVYKSDEVARALNLAKRRLNEHDFNLVSEFAEDLLSQGLSIGRIASYVYKLIKIREVSDRNFDEFEKRDIKWVINTFQMRANKGEISQNTVREIKKTLKKFFKWLEKEELVNWFTLGEVETSLGPADLITEDEFQRILAACTNHRDKAIVALLYESGCRVGELLSLRIKDVQFDEYGAKVWFPLQSLTTKKHRRKVRVVYSVPYLSNWLSIHPRNDDPDAPLFISLTTKRGLSYDGLTTALSRILKRAGIKKRIYPHLFRHTRATKLVTHMSESIVAKYMGWVPGTRMTKVYVHLADQDVDNAILKMYGIKKDVEEEDLKVIRCPRCTFINDGKARFCMRCGLPLTEDALKEVEEWEGKKAEVMQLLSDRSFLLQFMNMQEELETIKKIMEEYLSRRVRDGSPVGRRDIV